MKASELIQKLQHLIVFHGDLPVYVSEDGEYPEYETGEDVKFAPAQEYTWYRCQVKSPDRFEL